MCVLCAKHAGGAFPDAAAGSHGVSPFWSTKPRQHFSSPLLSIGAELTFIALYAKLISVCALILETGESGFPLLPKCRELILHAQPISLCAL